MKTLNFCPERIKLVADWKVVVQANDLWLSGSFVGTARLLTQVMLLFKLSLAYLIKHELKF